MGRSHNVTGRVDMDLLLESTITDPQDIRALADQVHSWAIKCAEPGFDGEIAGDCIASELSTFYAVRENTAEQSLDI